MKKDNEKVNSFSLSLFTSIFMMMLVIRWTDGENYICDTGAQNPSLVIFGLLIESFSTVQLNTKYFLQNQNIFL